jgi:hypothetical protein
VAHHARPAPRRQHEPGEDVDERGLAGAVGAEEPEELALPDAEADVVEGLQAAVVLGDSLDLDGRDLSVRDG